MVLGLLVNVMPSNFFSRILRSEALVYKSYFFKNSCSTEIVRHYILILFYKQCNFSCICLLVKMASKTVTRSICAKRSSCLQAIFFLNKFQPNLKSCSYLHISDTKVLIKSFFLLSLLILGFFSPPFLIFPEHINY